MPDSSIFTARR